jgi:hypothetical protein
MRWIVERTFSITVTRDVEAEDATEAVAKYSLDDAWKDANLADPRDLNVSVQARRMPLPPAEDS